MKVTHTLSKFVSPGGSWHASVAYALMLVLSSALAADQDFDGLDDAFENELMQRFAPLVKLHPDDEYRPTSVGWYLARVHMKFHHNNCPDCPDDIPGWSTDELLSKSHHEKNVFCSHNDSMQYSWNTTAEPSDKSDFYLQIPDGDDEFMTRRGGFYMKECYAHVRKSPLHHPRMLDIQYWFFYAFNGEIPYVAHEGDFEHITVRVEAEGRTIHCIFYAAHNDSLGRWHTAAQGGGDGYQLTDGRPIVYSAYHSHASYTKAGTWDWQSGEVPDATADGPEWDCKLNLVNVGEGFAAAPGSDWIYYSGHWGEMRAVPGGSGPYGPAFQGGWNADPINEDNPSTHGWVFVNWANSTAGDGSWGNPFRRLADAVAAVPTGGVVWIFPGHYPAVGTYTKGMTLGAVSGGVTLGR